MFNPNQDGKKGPLDIGDDFKKFLANQPSAGGLPPVDLNKGGAGLSGVSDTGPSGGEGNSQGPGERAGQQQPVTPQNPDAPVPGSPQYQPGTITPPSPEAHQGPMTPPMGSTPNPVAGGPGTPLAPPTPTELVSPLGGGMLGKAGGLLGGGLSTTDTMGSTEGNDSLLPLLLQLLSQKQNGQ